MREIAEFRVDERYASMLFADNEGERLGSIRKVKVETSDPRFVEVGHLQRHLAVKEDASFFFGWKLCRRYSKAELVTAARFHLIFSAVFEPPGEICGTKYDETKACQDCGSGAVQVGDLCIDLRRAPRGKDIARTIADEVIISQRGRVDVGCQAYRLRASPCSA